MRPIVEAWAKERAGEVAPHASTGEAETPNAPTNAKYVDADDLNYQAGLKNLIQFN